MGFFLSAERDSVFGEDRISGLPDDIILTIFSPMGMKEAAKTSIFSKRWRHLWATRTHLDFDHFLVLPDTDPCIYDCSFTTAQKGKYINWVNQVVDLYCNPCINTFRVCFHFDTSDAHHFDKWVKFALSKKVKNLELISVVGWGDLKLPIGFGDSGISSLMSLRLDGVDVSGDVIEFLLSKCHHLERLYVSYSPSLVRLKVIGSSCKLKELTINVCCELEELEIDAVTLTYFKYIGRRHGSTNIVFKSLPMLVELAFGGTGFGSPVSIFQQISHLAAHIDKLSLDMEVTCYLIPGGAIPTFCNLKHLNMVVTHIPAVDITPLLEACPVLHELKLAAGGVDEELEHFLLEVIASSSRYEYEKFVDAYDYEQYLDSSRAPRRKRKTHPNLKQLEVVGFRGSYFDVDTILFMMHIATNLETIICDTHSNDSVNDDDVLQTSRARAYNLMKIIPPKISVVIL